MSVLIEALRSAEAARTASGASLGTPSAPPLEVPRMHAAPRARRVGVIVAVGLLFALGLGWWWLQPAAIVVPAQPAAAPTRAAQATTNSTTSQAAAASDAVAAPAATPAAPATPSAARPVARPQRTAATRNEAPPPAAPAPAPAPLIERSAEPLPIEAAYRALRAGRFEEAQRLYEAVAASQPALADAWLGLASAREGRGDVAGAIAAYRRALQLEPDNAEALAALAELTSAGNPSAQASVLRAALARKPDAPSLHAALGRLLAAENRWSEARIAFEAAAALAPARAEYAFNLAVALDRLGEAQRAAALYESAAALAEREGALGVDPTAARARALELKAAKG